MEQGRSDRRKLAAQAAFALAVLGGAALARRPMADLRGQAALITGGSRGLGLLLAREFGRAGCRVAICARDAAELERAAVELADSGVEALTIPCDIGDRVQVEAMVERATGYFGSIDILVNNAGVIQVGPLETMTVADFEAAMEVIFWGTVYPTLATLPGMRARGSGRIVIVSSIGGKVAVPHLLPYSCAKFATTGFAEGLRAELAAEGIAVTTIVPGLMRTGSPLNADFKGRAEAEFAWFAIGDSLPFLSMDAERAAREIVEATRRGEAERILTLPANLAARAHGLMPGLSADMLGLVNRYLPEAEGGASASVSGRAARRRLDSPLLDGVIGWTLSAARRFNQHPGPRPAATAATAPATDPVSDFDPSAQPASWDEGWHSPTPPASGGG
jgi:short-subunit dehydrogenase